PCARRALDISVSRVARQRRRARADPARRLVRGLDTVVRVRMARAGHLFCSFRISADSAGMDKTGKGGHQRGGDRRAPFPEILRDILAQADSARIPRLLRMPDGADGACRDARLLAPPGAPGASAAP